MIRLHDYPLSGNCYKVRLLLALLGLPYERVERNTGKGETRTPEFLRKNPNGQIPVLETGDGLVLPESGAILLHLAEGTPFLPGEGHERAQVLRWMFFEQATLWPNLAPPRLWRRRGVEMTEYRLEALKGMRAAGEAALGVMEGHLEDKSFFVADRHTVADVSLYVYAHLATEGGFDLEPFPALRAWLEPVAAQPGHVPMTEGS